MMVMLSHPMTSLPNIINVTLVTPNDVCMMGVTSPGGANCEARNLPPQLFRYQNPCLRSSASLLPHPASRWAVGPFADILLAAVSPPSRGPFPRKLRRPLPLQVSSQLRQAQARRSMALGCVRRALLLAAPARRCRRRQRCACTSE